MADKSTRQKRYREEFKLQAAKLIVATARRHDCLLITSDTRILNYAHVRTVK